MPDQGPSYPDGEDIRERESQAEIVAEEARKRSGLRITRDVDWDIDTTPDKQPGKRRKSA